MVIINYCEKTHLSFSTNEQVFQILNQKIKNPRKNREKKRKEKRKAFFYQ